MTTFLAGEEASAQIKANVTFTNKQDCVSTEDSR